MRRDGLEFDFMVGCAAVRERRADEAAASGCLRPAEPAGTPVRVLQSRRNATATNVVCGTATFMVGDSVPL
jgi:hypothetical protein